MSEPHAMPQSDLTPQADVGEMSFEPAFERLQAISVRLSDERVPVSEMCALFAEGKGLERALSEFLETQRERIEAIERGEGVRTFHIVA